MPDLTLFGLILTHLGFPMPDKQTKNVAFSDSIVISTLQIDVEPSNAERNTLYHRVSRVEGHLSICMLAPICQFENIAQVRVANRA